MVVASNYTRPEAYSFLFQFNSFHQLILLSISECHRQLYITRDNTRQGFFFPFGKIIGEKSHIIVKTLKNFFICRFPAAVLTGARRA